MAQTLNLQKNNITTINNAINRIKIKENNKIDNIKITLQNIQNTIFNKATEFLNLLYKNPINKKAEESLKKLNQQIPNQLTKNKINPNKINIIQIKKQVIKYTKTAKILIQILKTSYNKKAAKILKN